MGNYDFYRRKGDEEYNLTIKDRVGTAATIRHLKKAKEHYNSARLYARNSVEKQEIKRELKDISNSLSILEREDLPRKKKVLGLFSSLDDRLGNLIEEIKGFKKDQKILPIFILFSFVFSLFLLSMNFTGAVVGTTEQDFSILGILFFILGLALTFFYARSKR